VENLNEVGATDLVRAYSVNEFVRAYRVSRATLYNLWRDGMGPTKMRVRGRTLISFEAADAWRRRMEETVG
jgi:hypothetical protein